MAKHFNPKRYPIVFGGAQLQGFAPDKMCKFEFDTDDTSDVVGVDGEVSFSVNFDQRAKLTVYLMQTSDSNDILSAARLALRLSANGEAVVALRCEDLNGRTVISGPECWVMSAPKPEHGKVADVNEWVIRIANAEAFFGGND